MSIRGGWFLACTLALAACGGASPRTESARVGTAGGEAGAAPVAAQRRPSGPPASYVREEHEVVVRIAMDAVRRSAVAEDIGSLVRSYPTWRDLLGSSGIDPVRDFDRVLLTGPGLASERAILVIRHHLGNARVREAVLQMASARGSRPEWREVEGLSVVEWPAQTRVPRLVVLTAPNELVVTTQADLEQVVEVANDHAARREGDESIEPALALEEGLIATVVAESLRTAGSRMRLQSPPESLELTVREDAGPQGTEPGGEAGGEARDAGGPRRIVLAARGLFSSEESAAAAERYLVEQRDFYAGQMLVRAVGLDRLLREARIAASGSALDLRASLTEEELRRVLGLLALGQLGGS
jgi:hypothetical protein